MAVVDKYVTDAVENDTRRIALYDRGVKCTKAECTFEVAAGDDNGSVYRLFKGLPTATIIENLLVFNDAITNGTDYDLGFYYTKNQDASSNGAVIDKDILADGMDLSSAHAVSAPLSGLTNVDLPDHVKSIRELLGLSLADDPGVVDLCLTANTVGTAAGSVLIKATFLPPVV